MNPPMKKRLLCGIIVLVCLVMTIRYITAIRNSYFTLQEGKGEGGSEMIANVRKIEPSTSSTIANSVRESPGIGNGEGGPEKSPNVPKLNKAPYQPLRIQCVNPRT